MPVPASVAAFSVIKTKTDIMLMSNKESNEIIHTEVTNTPLTGREPAKWKAVLAIP